MQREQPSNGDGHQSDPDVSYMGLAVHIDVSLTGVDIIRRANRGMSGGTRPAATDMYVRTLGKPPSNVRYRVMQRAQKAIT